MKILFLESIHNFGGASKSTLELAKRLISQGHQVMVVDFWGCCKPYVEQCQIENVPLKIIDPRDSPILLKVKGKFDTVKNYLGYLKKIKEYKKRMSKIISDYQPDLISVNSIKALSILDKSASYKIAYFARGWFLPKTFSFFDKQILKRRVDVFLTVSHSTQQMVFASGVAELQDIYVVHGAINFSEIRSRSSVQGVKSPWHFSDRKEFVMMHCGTFIETKGQHISVEVLKKLIDDKMDVKLLFAGLISQSEKSQDYYKHIKGLLKSYNLENHVEFVVNESDVLEYYATSDLLIHPSYSEGLPRVVIEAMAFGVPVVGNAVGGMIDIVSNNYTGFLTNFNNVDEYVNVIKELIKDKNKYKFISENASRLIECNYLEKNQIECFSKISHLVSNRYNHG